MQSRAFLIVSAAVAALLGIAIWISASGRAGGRLASAPGAEVPPQLEARVQSELGAAFSTTRVEADEASAEAIVDEPEGADESSTAAAAAGSPQPEQEDPLPPAFELIAVDSEGAPIANSQLVADVRFLDRGAQAARVYARTDAGGSARFGWDDALGSIELRGIAVAVHELDAAGESQTPAPTARGGAQVWIPLAPFEHGRMRDLGRVVLLLPRERHPAALCTGWLTDDKGQALGETVYTRLELDQMDSASVPGERGGLQLVLGDEGAFELFGPANPGRVRMCFWAEDYHANDVEFDEWPQHGVEVVLRRVITLRGKLLLPEGIDPQSFSVWMFGANGGTGLSVSPEGEFEAQGSSDALRIEVRRPPLGFVLWTQELERELVVDGEFGTVDLRNELRVLSLTVFDAGGVARASESVRAGLDDRDPTSLRTDAEGSLELIIPRSVDLVRVGAKDGGELVEFDPAFPPAELRVP